MDRLARLRQQLEARREEGRALLDAAEADDRDLTAEEAEQLDAIDADIEALQGEITSAEALAERRRRLGEARSSTALSPAGSRTVNDPNPETTGGFADIGEFAVAVHAAVEATRIGGTVDERLQRVAVEGAHRGGGEAGEGFLLPPEFRDAVWELVNQFDELGPLIDEEPTSARKVHMGADETTPWGASGIKAYWRKEGGKMTPSQLDLEGREVPLHELYTLALATEELLEDAPRLNNRLTRKAAEAIAYKKNAAIVEGSGVGQPLGWTKSKAQVVVPKVDGQAADTIVAENVAAMLSRLQMLAGSSPFWMINQDALPELMTMRIGDRPIWTPPTGFAGAPGGFLLGYPIRWSEFCETLGDQNDIQLINPRGYYGARRSQGPRFAISIHLYFDFGLQAFRWMFRYGGQPHLSKPVSPRKGVSTRSHFVTLAARG